MAPTWTFSAVCLALVSAASFSSPAFAVEAASDAASAPPCTLSATAKAGDSCVSLASANGLTVSQFLQINPTVRSCTLDAGTTYCVSTDPKAPAPPASSSSAAAPPPPPPPPPPRPPASSAASKPSISGNLSTTATIKPPTSATRAPPGSSASASAHSASAKAPSPSSNATAASSAAPAQGTVGLIPSPDGSDGICGGEYTCQGSPYGECCSANGYCGNSTEYCGEGCNPAYGLCGLCPAADTTTLTQFFTSTSVQVVYSTITTTALITVVPTYSTTTVTLTTTHSARPIATPSPTLPGVTANCTRWYLVRPSDTCRRIELTYSTTQGQLVNWNPGFDCDDIEDMAGNYICVAGPPVPRGGFGL